MKKIILTIATVALALFATGAWAEEKEGIRIQYKVGDGLKIGDGSNLVHLQGRVQGRYTYTALEATNDTNTFAIQRGKIKLEGHVMDKLIRFGFQMNLATRNRATTAAVCADAGCVTQVNAVTAESTTGLATLEDYYIDWVPYDYFGLKVGQFKVPYLMQELTSSGKQQFVDRSLSTGVFNFGRDIGATIHGEVFNGHLNYSVFAFNGDGANTINRNQSLLFGTRLEVPILGEYKPSESDVDHSEEHNLGVGIAYVYNQALGATQNGTVTADNKASHGTIDIGYKHKGFSVQTAAMVSRSHRAPKLTNMGYNAQVGYFVLPKKVELAVRTAGVVFSNAVANQYEHSAGVNYFIKGHGLKLQTDYALVMNNRGINLNDHRVRTQLQVIF